MDTSSISRAENSTLDGTEKTKDDFAESTSPNDRAESDNVNATQAQGEENPQHDQQSATPDVAAATNERRERFKALQARAVSGF